MLPARPAIFRRVDRVQAHMSHHYPTHDRRTYVRRQAGRQARQSLRALGPRPATGEALLRGPRSMGRLRQRFGHTQKRLCCVLTVARNVVRQAHLTERHHLPLRAHQLPGNIIKTCQSPLSRHVESWDARRFRSSRSRMRRYERCVPHPENLSVHPSLTLDPR